MSGQPGLTCCDALPTLVLLPVNLLEPFCCPAACAGIRVGPLNIPINVPRGKNNPGFVDWLYLDDDMRITRGSKGSLFIHMREALEDGQE